MKIVNFNFEHKLEFKENVFTTLVIENQKCFREYINELIYQIEGNDGNFVLSDNNSEIKMSEKVTIVTDYYSLNDKISNYDSKLQNELKKIVVNDDLFTKGSEVISKILNFAEEIGMEIPYTLEFTEPSLQNLLKFLKYRIVLDKNSLPELVLDFMKVSNWLVGLEIFVFVNICSFLTEDEIKILVSESLSLKYNLVFIENIKPTYSIDGEKLIIVDDDLCEIF